jgi:ABC-type nitrate/sulfonate/bicarbonate transport system permease component
MIRSLLLPLSGCLLVLVLWSFGARSYQPLLPPPSAVAANLLYLAAEGPLGEDVWASVTRVLGGVGIALLVTVLLGLGAALWPPFERIIAGPIELARPVPPIAWVPLAIMAFGVGPRSAIAIVTVGAFFPMWLSVARGLREIQKVHVLAARSLGAGPGILLSDIVLPSVLPHLLHGLRLGVGLGWFSVVAAEMMGAPNGLGRGIQMFSLNIEVTNLYAYILTTGAIGFACNSILFALERRAGHWHG